MSQIEFPKVTYNHETDEVHTSSTGSLISPHLPQAHEEAKSQNAVNSSGPSHSPSPRKGSRLVFTWRVSFTFRESEVFIFFWSLYSSVCFVVKDHNDMSLHDLNSHIKKVWLRLKTWCVIEEFHPHILIKCNPGTLKCTNYICCAKLINSHSCFFSR